MGVHLSDYEAQLEFIRSSQQYTTEIAQGVCYACGGVGPFEYAQVINDELAREWSLTPKERRAMSARESMFCVFCGCSQRLRNLSLAISLTFGDDPKSPKSLSELIHDKSFTKFQIAEINSCGKLHNILFSLPHLRYSEYEPADKQVSHQDLMALSYKDQSFDIVLTSDTLEHVPDPRQALKEIYRVLKKGGVHIFTVPALLDRQSKTRVNLEGHKATYLEPKSFHGSGEPDYLVWNEFGKELVDIITGAGFELSIYFMNVARLDDPSYVFVARRPASKTNAKSPRPVVYTDVTTKIDIDPEEFLKQRTVKTLDSNVLIMNKELQAERVQQLLLKLRLTENHARNLEEINADYKIHSAQIEKELNHIKQTKTYRLIQKARRIKNG